MRGNLDSLKNGKCRSLEKVFLPYQLKWIHDDSPLRIAEKSVRIGWTFADACKNVRKRLHYPRRDYLFSSKDQATAIEYVQTCYQFCEMFDQTRFILSRGIEDWKMPVYREGRNTGFTADWKVGYIKFDNRSRINSFSSNAHALRAYGGDVGLDEFAFHADPETLWGSASGRITWGFDLAIWSSHNGSDSLFYTFCREAAQGKGGWSHYRVTLTDAIEAGLVEKINQARGMNLSREQFLKNCKERSRLPEVFEQEYMCSPNGGTAGIVPWSAIERCMLDYEVERLHFEEHQIQEVFGEYRSEHQHERERQIESALCQAFKKLFDSKERHRLGFDVAASGRGNLTVIYVDQVEGDYGGRAKLAGLFTCRTQDWNFIKTALYVFMLKLNSVEGCGDETGLGRQICWEAAQRFGGYFTSINFASEKHNIGFTLMNQLAVGEKQFPRSERDVASDFFALRKHYTGSKWLFTESVNCLNASSHCDIAWAGGLASKANRRYADCGGLVG